MKNSEEYKHKRIVTATIIMSVLFVLILIIFSNKPDQNGFAYYNEIGIINNKLWYVQYNEEEKAYVLYCKDDEEIRNVFFKDISCPVYSSYDNCFYYVHKNAVYSYDPAFEQNVKVVDLPKLPLKFCRIDDVTEDYILLCDKRTGYPVGILNLYNKTVTNLNIEEGTDVNRTCATNTNKFFFVITTDTLEILSMFHCYDNSMDTIVINEKNTSKHIKGAQLYKDTIYYFESDGTLYSVKCTGSNSYSKPEMVTSIRGIIAMSDHEDGIVFATLNDENTIDFIMLADSGEVTPLDTWDNNKYLVPGTCLLSVKDNKLACVITNENEFYFETVIK